MASIRGDGPSRIYSTSRPRDAFPPAFAESDEPKPVATDEQERQEQAAAAAAQRTRG